MAINQTRSDEEQALQVVLIAERDDLVEAITREIEGVGVRVALRRVQEGAGGGDLVDAFPADVVIAVQSNPRAALDAYRSARAIRPSAPFILLMETLDEESVVTFARYHPDNLVLLGNLARLRPAVLGALEKRRPLTRLSRRQLEVLVHIADGRSTRDIAEDFGLSVKTVESHRSTMMKRLGLHAVAALVRYALSMGLIPTDPIDARKAGRLPSKTRTRVRTQPRV